jgi:glycosyltransferase involved in cell wall biosynthesis
MKMKPDSMQAPVKVLYCEGNTDGTIGGSYYSMLFLASGLDRQRYEPAALFYTDHALLPRFRSAGIGTWVMNKPRPMRARLLRKPVNLLKLFVLPALRYARFIRRHAIGLVHLNNSILLNQEWMLASALARVPCVSHERGINPSYSRRARFWSSRIAGIICISEAVRESMLRGGLSSSRMVVVHNALDPEEMRVDVPRRTLLERYGIGADDPVIGLIGNLKAWKGQRSVIEAVDIVRRHAPGIRCLLVGRAADGDEAFEAGLRRLVARLELGDNIFFTGGQANVANFINAMDVVLHASIQPEPFGRVLLEAMALRKPVIASGAGGVPEIVLHDRTGLLFEPGNERAMAAAINALIGDPEKARRLGENGYRRLCDSFRMETHTENIQDFYDQITS